MQQLDLLHRLEVMEFALSSTRRGSTAGGIVLHDPGLAAPCFDTIALLSRGRIVRPGTPEEVFTTETIRETRGVEASIQRCPATGALQVIPVAPAAGKGGES